MTQFISQLKAERALSGSLPGDLDLNDHILNERNKDHTVQYLSFRFQSMLLLVRFSHVLQSKSCSELYLETRCITWRLSQDVSTLYWYGVVSHDVTAAILVSQNNERRPCWCPKPVLWKFNSFLMSGAPNEDIVQNHLT